MNTPLKQEDWKEAVIEQLVVCGILRVDHENDPELAIKSLMQYAADMATDPVVSSAAATLIRRGKMVASLEFDSKLSAQRINIFNRKLWLTMRDWVSDYMIRITRESLRS
jgi:hypothetical protein